jgi:hypothetical protein
VDTLPVAEWLEQGRTYILTGAIMAFTCLPGQHDAERFGPVCELPEGADLQVCGNGVSGRTVKVRFGDCYYFVFWRDLASAVLQSKSFYQTAAAGQ